MVKVVVAVERPDDVAWIVIEPFTVAFTDLEATPAIVEADPSPLTAPAPLNLANVTVRTGEATLLSCASRTSTVSVRLEPRASEVVGLVNTSFVAVPGVIVKAVVPERSPVELAWIVIEPAFIPVTVLETMPADEIAVAPPTKVTVPRPAVLAKVTV